MYIDTQATGPGGQSFEAHLRDVMQPENAGPAGDVAEFSEQAVAAFREAAIEPIKNGTFSLESLEARIRVVESEIVDIWNSALPDDEKYMQISARKNEIALLKAGQFAFAKAGFAKSV